MTDACTAPPSQPFRQLIQGQHTLNSIPSRLPSLFYSIKPTTPAVLQPTTRPIALIEMLPTVEKPTNKRIIKLEVDCEATELGGAVDQKGVGVEVGDRGPEVPEDRGRVHSAESELEQGAAKKSKKSRPGDTVVAAKRAASLPGRLAGVIPRVYAFDEALALLLVNEDFVNLIRWSDLHDELIEIPHFVNFWDKAGPIMMNGGGDVNSFKKQLSRNGFARIRSECYKGDNDMLLRHLVLTRSHEVWAKLGDEQESV